MVKTVANKPSLVKRITGDSRSIGAVLVLCTVISLWVANTDGMAAGYAAFWESGFDGTDGHHWHLGWLTLPNSLSLVINDALMAVFFFAVGMEIKKEFFQGELASARQAALPVAAAMGGMIAPALLFTFFNRGGEYMHGWAIPTATDIAFTLGIAGLLGRKVPGGLRLFITALAIIDDLLAIVIIACFYGASIEAWYIFGITAAMAALWLLNRARVRFGIFHWLLGAALWYCTYRSGIHATIAGVLFAFMVPATHLKKYEERLYIPVYFIIIPLFALCNTAIRLPNSLGDAAASPLTWGIVAGLCLGKPLGIFAACQLLVKRKIAKLPRGVNWSTLAGGGILCGIGFTMSIFIATLAYDNRAWQDTAKIAVMSASLLSVIGGSIWLAVGSKNKAGNQ